MEIPVHQEVQVFLENQVHLEKEDNLVYLVHKEKLENKDLQVILPLLLDQQVLLEIAALMEMM